MTERFAVGSSPHIHAPLDTQKIMAWVLVSLLPAGAVGVWFLGSSSLVVIATCVVVCVGILKVIFTGDLNKDIVINKEQRDRKSVV